MALRLEIQGTDRTSAARLAGLSLTRRVGEVGTCAMTLQSKDASWRPALMESVEIWDPYRRVTDGAITSADKTLTSATAAFTAGDVGADVRLANAGLGGYSLYATIASYTSATEVELDLAASSTRSAKELLIGTCRFRGYLNDLPETRIGSAASTREWPCQAVDLIAATKKLWMPTTYTGASATLLSHIDSIVKACDEQAHGIRVVQTGGASSAWTQDPSWLYDALVFSLAQNFSDTSTPRWWTITPLGRVIVDEYNGWAYPGSDLSAANSNILFRPSMTRSGNAYWNAVTVGHAYEPYAGLWAYQETDYSNTTEINALGGRMFQSADIALCESFAPYLYANPNVPAWVESASDAQTYAASLQAAVGQSAWVLDVDTFEEGISPGMTVTVDLSELGISSVDHFVQEVTSVYLPNGAWRHRLQCNGQQVTYTTPWDRWRSWR